MWLDLIPNPGHLALESDALQTALHGPASAKEVQQLNLNGPDQIQIIKPT